MKVAICIPHYGDPKAGFAKALADLLIHTMGARINYNGTIVSPEIEVLWEDAGPLELKRTRLALRAWSSDYLLFIDSDQTFPPDTLLALARRDQPIVGCNYLNRREPWPTALTEDEQPMWTTEEKAKADLLEPAAAIGLGFCLVKTPVLHALEGKILFRSDITPDGVLRCGEDVHFCNIVRTAGFRVLVDHALSWRIGHIAEVTRYNSEGRNADIAQPSAGP